MSCPNSKAPLTNTEKPPPTKEPSSSARAEPKPSSRGRKPSSKQSAAAAAAPKKIPQRGLGVAQLERLRMQEKWKKMTETPSADHSPPLESVPVQYGAGGPYGGAARLYPGGGVGMGSGMVMDHGNTLYQHHHQMTNNNNNNQNYYYYQYQQQEPKNNGSFEYFDNLSFNFKKKRFNGEIGLQMGNNNNGNFNNVGLNMYCNLNNINNNNIDQSLGDHLTLGFGTSSKVPRTSSDPHNQGYVAVHKRVHSTAATNGGFNNNNNDNEVAVMEYEFFPGLINDGGGVVSRGSKEMVMMRSLGGANNIININNNNNQEGSNHYYAAANNSVTANSGSTSSNNSVISYNNFNHKNNSHSLDLSLRL